MQLRTNYPYPGRSIDVESIKRNAYQDQNILVVGLDHPALSWVEREMLKQVAEKIYGRQ